MQLAVEPVARLVEELTKLPGIGPKTAQRLVFHLLRVPSESATGLAHAILRLREEVSFCSVCWNLTDRDPCWVCQGQSRDRALLCVVEDPLDLLAIERSGSYKGQYHVLHGALSPIEGIGPDDLKIGDLLERLRLGTFEEVILATNPTVEGEATALYLERVIRPLAVKLSRLARGLPVGADLEYADDLTLARAVEGRMAL